MSDPSAPRFTPKNWIGLLLRVGATVLIFALMAYFIDLGMFAEAIGRVDWRWFAAGCIGSAIFVALRIVKWIVLARRNGLHGDPVDITRTMLLALALGLVTPARIGEVIAVAPFPKENRARAIFVYAYDRVCELFSVLVFCVPAAFVFLGWPGLAAAIGAAVFGLLVLAAIESSAWRSRFAESRLMEKIPKIRALMTAALRTSPEYWAVSVAGFLVAYATVSAFIAGVEPIKTWQSFAILPVVTLSNIITVTVGGLGVREGLAAAMSPRAGLTPEVAAAAFFIAFITTRLIPAAIGLIWTAATRIGARSAGAGRAARAAEPETRHSTSFPGG